MDKKKLSIKEIGIPKLVILFLAGILLVVLSVPDLFSSVNKVNKTEEKNVKQNNITVSDNSKETGEMDSYVSYYEKRLKDVLEKVEGIGKVEVMITLQSSKEQVVLKDTPSEKENLSESDEAGGSRISSSEKTEESTVLIKNESGDSVPYVTKELEASVEGVVVIAEGGGDGNIAVNIVEAVEVLFNVPAHKVKVLPMSK